MAKTNEIKVDGKSLTLSNLEKVYYPKIGFTKGEVIDYYINVAPVLLPHLKGRALTLKRYPKGVEAPFFYEKRCPKPRPSFVKTCQIARHHEAGKIEFCIVENLPTLVWIVNLGDLEMHTSLARSRYPEKPTQVVFDLDPGEGSGAVDCAKAALLVRDLMRKLNLESFVKSSGSKGIQVYVPINSAATYEETSLFAKKTAQLLEKDHSDLVVSNMEKSLRVGKVLIDWSQNAEMKTTVCVYSLRAKERPLVSMPLLWTEVEECVKSQNDLNIFFEAKDALKRINEKGDLFEPTLLLKQNIKKALTGFDSIVETKRKISC